MVSCSDDHTLCLWLPCSSKKPVARMIGHMQPVIHVAFSPDGSMIASASFDKSVKIWDGHTGEARSCCRRSIWQPTAVATFTYIIVLFVFSMHFAAPTPPSLTALTRPPAQANFSAVASVTWAQCIRWHGPATAACWCRRRKTAPSRFGTQRRASWPWTCPAMRTRYCSLQSSCPLSVCMVGLTRRRCSLLTGLLTAAKLPREAKTARSSCGGRSVVSAAGFAFVRGVGQHNANEPYAAM